MEIGIFSRIFARPTLDEAFAAVVDQGLHVVQFNYLTAGIDDMPGVIDDAMIAQVNAAVAKYDMQLAGVSGTFNMIHPDPAVRATGLEKLAAVIASAPRIGAKVVTLCTGTRNPASMWRHHPDTASPEAWRDLLASMETALAVAAEHGVMLAVEPEVSNVMSSPQKARRLLDEMQSPHLGIIMDGANVFPAGTLDRQHEILDEAFALLGDDIVLAHAKDISRDGEAGHEAAGTGLLDYGYYVKLLDQSAYSGPLVAHSLTEAQAPQVVAFLRGVIDAVGA
ncbi:MAG: sugar phosphate isomerase/epimerase family protein [Caldilineaceae bacterium]